MIKHTVLLCNAIVLLQEMGLTDEDLLEQLGMHPEDLDDIKTIMEGPHGNN